MSKRRFTAEHGIGMLWEIEVGPNICRLSVYLTEVVSDLDSLCIEYLKRYSTEKDPKAGL